MSWLRLLRLEIAVKIGSEPRTNKFLSKRENPSDSERSHGPFYPELFVLQTNERRKCIQHCALYPKPKGCHAQSSVKSQSSDDPAFVLRNREFLCGSKIMRRASLDPSIQNVQQNNHNHPKCPTLCLIFRETLYHCAHCGRGIATSPAIFCNLL